MSSDAAVPECLTDPRDRFLTAQAPLLPMPRFGALPPPPIGGHQYVGAADGLYVQARHHGIETTAPLTRIALPYGPLQPALRLSGGPIPPEIVHSMARAAVAACPLEWAGVVQWDEAARHYDLSFPRIIARSEGEITYDTQHIDPERVVCIVHSHGHHPAFFSIKDDSTDRSGLYVAAVLGNCHSLKSLSCCSRLVVEGHRFPLPHPPWVAP